MLWTSYILVWILCVSHPCKCCHVTGNQFQILSKHFQLLSRWLQDIRFNVLVCLIQISPLSVYAENWAWPSLSRLGHTLSTVSKCGIDLTFLQDLCKFYLAPISDIVYVFLFVEFLYRSSWKPLFMQTLYGLIFLHNDVLLLKLIWPSSFFFFNKSPFNVVSPPLIPPPHNQHAHKHTYWLLE